MRLRAFDGASIRGGALSQLRGWRWLVPLVVSRVLDAQGAATVPASSLVYDKLESISAYYPVRGVFLGERSLSRRQIERAVARLSAALDSAKGEEGSNRRAWARRELESVHDALSADDVIDAGMRTRVVTAFDV